MRLVWGLVAAIGLLVGTGLAYERFTPPDEVTQPITPHGAILTGGMAQPALASELALPTPTRRPPIPLAPSAPSVNLAQPAAPATNAPEMSQPGAARAAQSSAPSTAQARDEAPPAPAAVADDARLTGARPLPAVTGGARYDVARPRPTRPKVDAPRVSAPTPTPCVLEPPPRQLDGAAPALDK